MGTDSPAIGNSGKDGKVMEVGQWDLEMVSRSKLCSLQGVRHSGLGNGDGTYQ